MSKEANGRRVGARRPEGGVEAAPAVDREREGHRDHQARDDAGEEQLADRGLGKGAIDQQAEARAIRARMQAESVANSVALHYGLFPFAFACINEQPAPVFNKGDRVYVKFAIDKFEIIDGNSYRVNGGFFEGDGVIDRAEDDYLYGRLDDGRPFMCKLSDVTRLAIIDGTAEDSKGLNKSLLFIFLIIGALALKVFL